MSRFWKFNNFVGTVGFVLLVAAYFSATHAHSLVDGVLNVSFAVATRIDAVPIMLGLTGGVFIAWQIVMTILGLLAGFFRAPGR